MTKPAFEAYSIPHGLVLVLTIAACVGVIRRARSQPNPRQDRVLLSSLRIFALATIVPHHLVKVFVMGRALLGLCDLAGIAALVVLFRKNRLLAALVLYWGLVLTPNALLTPDLPAPAFSFDFFLFFGSHMAVVITACFVTFGERLVLTWRLYLLACAFNVVLLLFTLSYNAIFDTNYMYLMERPPSGSLLDLLGPWPWYVVAGALLTAAAWALLTVPFLRRSSASR